MKWKNKGHEFEQYVKAAIEPFFRDRYYIFGAGLLGQELLSILQWYTCSITFIDNSAEKQKGKISDLEVISLKKYLEVKDGQIIIAASPENTIKIKKQLEGYSLKRGIDYFLYDEFIHNIFPIISVYCYGKSYMALAQITLTERCTLKCKKCAHGCFAIDNATAKDFSLEQVYKSADSFFDKIDFIKEFVLIGGEPLLYKELAQGITYIGERYRKRISIFSITTNGTVIPNEDVLMVCKKYNILFRISNYAHQIPKLRERYLKLVDTLEEYNISFILGEEESEWMDYGFEYVDRGPKEEGLITAFDACHTPCREIRENRLYFCVMARSVSDNLKFNVGNDDYLDLECLSGDDYKKELLEFTLGYSDKGYLDMCRHCHGAEAKNYPIVAAEQVEKNDK